MMEVGEELSVEEIINLTIHRNKFKIIIEESKNHPNQVDFLFSVAKTYFINEDYHTVIELYKKLIELEPEYKQFYEDILFLYILKNDSESAIIILRKLSSIESNNFAEDYEKEADSMIQVIKNSANPVSQKRLDFFHKDISFKSFDSVFDKIIYQEDEVKLLKIFLKVYSIENIASLKKKIFERLLEFEPQTIDYLLSLARLNEKYNDFEKAMIYYKQILEISENNSEAIVEIGEIEYHKGNIEKAISYFEKLLYNGQKNYIEYAKSKLFDCYIQKKEFQKVFNLKIDEWELSSEVEKILKNMQLEQWESFIIPSLEYDEFVKAYNSIINYGSKIGRGVSTSNKESIYDKLSTKIKMEIFKRADELSFQPDYRKYFTTIEELKFRLNEFPEDSRAWSNLGYLYRKINVEESINCFFKCLSLQPDDEDSLDNLIEIYKEQKEYNKLIECLKKKLELEPLSDWNWTDLGEAYSNINEYSKAIDSYQNALNYNDKSFLIFEKLGWMNYNLGNKEKAFQNWETYFINIEYFPSVDRRKPLYEIINILFKNINENPKVKTFLENLGTKYNDPFIFKKLLDIDSDNINYLNSYLTYGRMEIVIEDAIKYYNKLIKLDSNNYIYYYRLGECYFILQNHEEAIQNYLNSINFISNDINLWKKELNGFYRVNFPIQYLVLISALNLKFPNELNDILPSDILSIWYKENGNLEKYYFFKEKNLRESYLSYSIRGFSPLFEFYLQRNELDKAINLVEEVIANQEKQSNEPKSSYLKNNYFPNEINISEDIQEVTIKEFIEKIPIDKRWLGFFDKTSHAFESKINNKVKLLFLEKQFEINPERNLILKLAENYKVLKENDKAIKYYSLLEDERSQNKLALFYVKQGMIKQAKEIQLNLLEKTNIKDNISLNYFYTFCTETDELDFYLEVLNKKLKETLENETFSLLCSAIGDGYFYRKEYSDAISHYEKSYESKQNQMLIAYIGQSYYMLNNYQKAFEYFIRALESESDIMLRSGGLTPFQIVVSTLFEDKKKFEELSISFRSKTLFSQLKILLLKKLPISLNSSDEKIKMYELLEIDESWKIHNLRPENLFDLGKSYYENREHKKAEDLLKKAKQKFSEFGIRKQSLHIANRRENNKKKFIWDINNLLNNIKKVKENEFKNKQGYLSFLSHTLRNALSGGSQTIERVMESAKEALKEDFIKNEMSYNAFSDLAGLHSTFTMVDSMMETFKLFTREENQFIEKWNEKENGEATPEYLIGYALKQLLYRLLFSDSFQDERERLFQYNSEEELKLLQQKFLLDIGSKDFKSESIGKLLEWFRENLLFLKIEIDDKQTKWNIRGVKFNMIFSIVSEILLNALKYSDGKMPIQLEWKLQNQWSSNKIQIICKNTYDKESIKNSDSKSGLEFIENMLAKLKNVKFSKEKKEKSNSSFRASNNPQWNEFCVNLELEGNK